MDKIRILFIIDVFYKMAGAEKNLFEVVTRLDKDKFEPIVACLQQGVIAERLTDHNIINLNLNIKKIYSLSALTKGWRLLRFLRDGKIDIVVTYHEGSDFFGGIVAKLAGVPVVISSRRDMGYRLKPRHVFFYSLMNRIFDRVVTVSEAVKDRIFESQKVPYHRLVTVHNGIDSAPYTAHYDAVGIRAKLKIAPDAVVVGIVAALRKIKGHQVFFEAATMLVKKFPNVRFLVAGSADDLSYRKELEELVRSLNLSEHVIFTGEYKNVPELLSAIDISVLASYNEGFSNTILESMAAGKPVVATNTGGTPEAVIDGETGLLVAPGDPVGLAEAIYTLLSDKDLRRKMGAAGSARVAAFFDNGVMMAKLQNLYSRLLRDAGTGRRAL